MARLVYSMIASLDGYVADRDGRFGWAVPDDEVHAFVNELERSIGCYLYGRRMYEVIAGWEDVQPDGPEPSPAADFAGIWQAADKIVYSRSLPSVSTRRTRIERELEPASIRRLKAESALDISIGGPGLAGQAIAAGLVDDLHLLVTPIVVGGGTRALPDGVRWELELVEEHRFAGGFVHLHYRTRR